MKCKVKPGSVRIVKVDFGRNGDVGLVRVTSEEGPAKAYFARGQTAASVLNVVLGYSCGNVDGRPPTVVEVVGDRDEQEWLEQCNALLERGGDELWDVWLVPRLASYRDVSPIWTAKPVKDTP